jgi:hypothetical protein
MLLMGVVNGKQILHNSEIYLCGITLKLRAQICDLCVVRIIFTGNKL